MIGVSAFLPTYVQGAMGRSATAGGLVLGMMSVTWAIASFYGGRLMVRTTYRLTAVLGTLALIAGSAVLIALTPERGVIWASVGSLLIGIGMGLCNTTFIVSIQAAVPWHQRGAATSSCMFLRFAGQSVGAAAFGAVLNLTMLREAPEAVHMVDRLLDPAQRGGLAPAELVRAGRCGGARAAQHLPAGGAAVRRGAGVGTDAAGAAEPGEGMSSGSLLPASAGTCFAGMTILGRVGVTILRTHETAMNAPPLNLRPRGPILDTTRSCRL